MIPLSLSQLGLPSIGITELLIILFIILILFGAKKLPELARGIGEAVREFRKASTMEPSKEELSSMSRDEVAKIAEKLGISTQGKNREELAAEVMKHIDELKAQRQAK
jgi:sec-independent protein translocase protein TatA